jgi:hypothetical protein
VGHLRPNIRHTIRAQWVADDQVYLGFKGMSLIGDSVTATDVPMPRGSRREVALSRLILLYCRIIDKAGVWRWREILLNHISG